MGAALVPLMLAGSLAGAGIGAAGAYGQSEAQANTAAYQAQVAANNAKIANTNAGLEVESGEVQASNQQMKSRAQVGATLAGQGASGVDVNSGSPVAVRSGEAELGMLDALTIRSNAARRAYGYQVAATSDTAQSQLYQTESEDAAAAAPWNAASSLLSGASSAGAKYAMWQNVGGSGGSTFGPEIMPTG